MRLSKLLAVATSLLAFGATYAHSQTWTPINHQPPVTVGAMVQLRDGRVLVHEEQDGDNTHWWLFTPDSTGSYKNGTWSQAGSLPSDYGPVFFSSQVMLDGKHVIVEGGEYNFLQQVETNKGAIYDVTTNTWTANAPPSGWPNIGDAQSIILADGRYMQAESQTNQSAFYNGPNSWVASGNILGPRNVEASYTLLHSGKVLLTDTFNVVPCSGSMSSEIFDPSTNTWSCGPALPAKLWDSGHELGPAILMYNNKVLQVGGVPGTALYDPSTNTWAAGPTPPGGLDAADAPGALETNGKVLLMLSPGEFQPGCQFMEYSPGSNTLANVANPANCPADTSFFGHLMILPTGEIMFTDYSTRVELFTSAPGPGANNNRPTILGTGPLQHFTQSGLNNVVMGYKLNGVTQNNAYGDDYQGDTNYPLVRITNMSTGQVYWGNTHDESTHSIDPNAGVMTTNFDLPAGFPRGANYKVEVIVNGLPSNFLVYN